MAREFDCHPLLSAEECRTWDRRLMQPTQMSSEQYRQRRRPESDRGHERAKGPRQVPRTPKNRS
uniref:Uncharacterized protein n=1 Tax=Tetraselmis sp. GSL018 TaxID=582737 RepID=A0A061S3F1_9CHLO